VVSLLVGDGDQHVGMAGLTERAIAGEIAAAELALGVFDRDPQASGEEVVTESIDGLAPAEIQ
jgi:hypothetical protein